jgi:hypothetical protein
LQSENRSFIDALPLTHASSALCPQAKAKALSEEMPKHEESKEASPAAVKITSTAEDEIREAEAGEKEADAKRVGRGIEIEHVEENDERTHNSVSATSYLAVDYLLTSSIVS